MSREKGFCDYQKLLMVQKNVINQKRLVLRNIREAYLQYKSTFPDDKIGFSKFAGLQPKWCRTVGQSDSHNVCVCIYHQNVKLMLSAVNPTLRYQVLLEMCVCDVTRKDCMLNKCEDCPGFENVVDFLRNEICKKWSADDTISFKQWEKVDHSELMDDELPVDEFLEVIVEKLKKLLSRHFIYKRQQNFLKNKKETLSDNECIIILDFAENYTFMVQDAIQSFHWNNTQATIHPFVIYYKQDGTLKHKSLACISDMLQHDVHALYAFQKTIILNVVKKDLQQIEKVIHFSDGCSGQYKNHKNLTTLTSLLRLCIVCRMAFLCKIPW